MRRILVTGGLGFIGSNFIRFFLANNQADSVINLDKITYCGNPENLKDVERDSRYRFVKGDVCDNSLVERLLKESDAVINFAAETHVDRSIEGAKVFIETNVIGTETLLCAARRRGIKHFLHISTDEVYGSIERGSFKETDPLSPNSPYAASKAAADLLIRAYEKTYGYKVIVVRSTNNFGPYQYPEKVIPLFITNLIEGKKVPLYSRGENMRDWIYVEDNCRAIDLVFHKGEPGTVYNIGTGSEITNIELTRKILKVFSKTEDCIEYVTDRPGHDFRYSLDTSRVRSLGFKPHYSFDEALSKTADWYRSHESWWRSLKKDKFTVKL